MEYNNLLDIYDRMVDVSNQLHEEHSFDCVGFDRALFTLRHALLQYVPVNLHLENRNLKRQLEHALSKLKESNIARDANLQENKKLRSENQVLTIRLNSLRSAHDKLSKNKVLK